MSFSDLDLTQEEIEHFCNLVSRYALAIIQFFKNIWIAYFKPKNYYIQKAHIVYIRDGADQDVEDVTQEYRRGGAKQIMNEKSTDVVDFYFRVKYLYNSRQYLYITRNATHVFPPLVPKMTFRLPIKEAFLLDSDNVPMYNITDEIKMYEGPHCDFHDETIQLCDMLGDEDNCPAVRLVNIMGTVTEYKLATDSINHRTLWSPNKT